MIVLGFDTATQATAVALRLADGRSRQLRDDPLPRAHPGHATRLLAMASELLAGARLDWSEIDRIAVGVGPGTFTGLRVGVATARALAQALNSEIVGVSSLAALAAGASDAARAPADGAHGYTVLAVIDARRGEAFAGAYDVAESPPRELVPARALAPELFASALATVPREGRSLAVGDGAVRFREQLELLGASVPADDSPLHLVSAEATCELGALAPAAAGFEQIAPDYRRRPDAQIALDAAAAGAPRRDE